jgi:hypothetical protein
VQQVSYSMATEIASSDPSFLFFFSSDTYDYAHEISLFARAAHESQIRGNFLLVDVALQENRVGLDFPFFPALFCPRLGRSISGHFTYHKILTFLNQNTIPAIGRLETAADLEFFLDTAGFGLIAAYENASDHTLPVFTALQRAHYMEMTLAYCDPTLAGHPGFFVHRFSDNSVFEIPQTLFGATPELAESIIERYVVPDIFRADDWLLKALEDRIPRLGIIILDMQDQFYLNDDQLAFARTLKQQCGVMMCFEPVKHSGVTARRYHFPETSHSEFRFIEFKGGRYVKYRMEKPLTLESASEFCCAIASGKELPISDEFGDPIDRVTSQNVELYLTDRWSLVGFCEDDAECMRNLSLTKKDLKLRGVDGLAVASFTGRITDWPLPLRCVGATTAALLFLNGVLVAPISGDTFSPEELSDEIFHQISLIERDGL